jgi:hypothetical protein
MNVSLTREDQLKYPFLALSNVCRIRRLFAQEHVDWNLEQWSNVLVTDESRFCLHHIDGRVRVCETLGGFC